MYIGFLIFLLCVGIGKYAMRNRSSLRVRRLTVIGVTFIASWLLFLALDAWWRAGETNYWKTIYLLVGCTLRAVFTGHACNFIG
jgi:hypothetical protein